MKDQGRGANIGQGRGLGQGGGRGRNKGGAMGIGGSCICTKCGTKTKNNSPISSYESLADFRLKY